LQAACLLVFIRGKRIAAAVLVRSLYATLLFVCIAVAACGHDAPVSPSSQSGVARAPVTLKVMTFNIQHGIDGKSHYDIQSAITAIARTQPDIVGLQEVTRNHPFYACDDQPARLADGLRAATGQNWDVTYQQEWFTPDVSCQTSGRGDGRETEGLAFLTRRGLGGSATTALPDSRIGLQTTVRDAYGLPVVVTHLTSGGSASGTRRQQIDRLLSWMAAFGAPLVVMGDFNVGPDGPELQPVLAGFHDAWTDALQMGRATGNANSHGTQRIDYIFFTPGATLSLDAAEVVNTTALIGVAASDHEPVVATFTVR
jgi:endonuclease/exonuclease/phosphatase family metal-dependent hydrolase